MAGGAPPSDQGETGRIWLARPVVVVGGKWSGSSPPAGRWWGGWGRCRSGGGRSRAGAGPAARGGRAASGGLGRGGRRAGPQGGERAQVAGRGRPGPPAALASGQGPGPGITSGVPGQMTSVSGVGRTARTGRAITAWARKLTSEAAPAAVVAGVELEAGVVGVGRHHVDRPTLAPDPSHQLEGVVGGADRLGKVRWG